MEQVVIELLLSAFALGDVAINDNQLRDFAVGIADRAGDGLKHAPASILMLDAVFEAFADTALTRLARGLQHPHAIVEMNLLER